MAHRSLTALELHEAMEEVAPVLARSMLRPRFLFRDISQVDVNQAEVDMATVVLSKIYGTSFKDTKKALEHRISIAYGEQTEGEPTVVGPPNVGPNDETSESE